MWKLIIAGLAVPACALVGQNLPESSTPAQAEATKLAQLNIMNDAENMDLVRVRAMQNHAVSMQTYAMVAAR